MDVTLIQPLEIYYVLNKYSENNLFVSQKTDY